MESKIIKVSPELKRVIGHLINTNDDDRGWDAVAVVLFESDGILVYKKEYGNSVKISYQELIEKGKTV